MKKQIVIIDYGRGNLRSVAKALEFVGAKAAIKSSASAIRDAAGLILPGVGAFGDAMKALTRLKLVAPIQKALKAGKPLLGVCLGLQILFEEGLEYGRHKGLGFFSGTIRKFKPGLKVPHMGWNQVWQDTACPLFKGLPAGRDFYFVHSFRADAKGAPDVAATTSYGREVFASAMWRGNVFATQFHPEKSQAVGLKLYQNYWDFVRKQ